MSNAIQPIIDKVVSFQHLETQEAEHAFQIIMNGGATPAQMAAFLVGLRMKGETVEEITAGARVMRAKARPFIHMEGAIDTCGTGGDGCGTYNVSTVVAFILAAAGVPVVKHGNRSISSRSGSSDVLSALGVEVNADYPVLESCLHQAGIVFLMAPRFHSAMRHVAPVRQELAMRTIFNLIGPLSNPAKPDNQVLGVYDKRWLRPLAEVLKELGVKRAMVVHGADGLDELTVTAPSYVAEVMEDGSIREYTLTPEETGLPVSSMEQLTGGDAQHNAQAVNRLLTGEAGAYRDIVLLNAGAALYIAGKSATIKEGIVLAAEIIDSRKAQAKLAELVNISTTEIEA